MQNDDRLTPMEKELEAALAGLQPSRAAMDRDRMMFGAGQVSMRRRSHIWQGVCVSLVGALLVSIVTRPASDATPRDIHLAARAERQAPRQAMPAAARDTFDRKQLQAVRDYVRMRQAVLDRGIQALPASETLRPNHSEPPLTREHLDEILSST